MKISSRNVKWEHEPWTVIRTSKWGSPMFYAFNTRTGERKPVKKTYDAAFADIPKTTPYAEPWGV